MNIDLYERIKTKEKAFSKGQRLIAKYISEHYDKASFMTAAKFGSTVGVSESTVVRFAVEIGYSGYPELQQAMQDMIRNRLTSVQRLELTSENHKIDELLDMSISQDIDLIKRTFDNISEDNFYTATNAIANSKSVYILGAGSSLALATFLKHYFSLAFDKVVLIDAVSEASVLQQLMRVGKEDAIIGISFPRYSKRAIKALKYAADRGACTVAITDVALSPLAMQAEHVLLAKSDIASFVDSLVAPLSLINALIISVCIKRKEVLTENLNSLEEIWDEYGVYEKAEE